MVDNLVIVESPAKAKTIEKFLGSNFLVKSSLGHIRDLKQNDFSIDVENHFKPNYVVPDDKQKLVSELKQLSKQAKMVWLATDEDREGEAIAWHLAEVLELKSDKTQRIVFHEITKDAILNAVNNPRTIDYNLVNAQQARRILDRIVGFEVSPILWKKIKPGLSAGRVQSVAVKLIVEREREIQHFNSEPFFRVIAQFAIENSHGAPVTLKAELNKRFKTKEETEQFLEKCSKSNFKILDTTTRPGKRSPAPPFTTSTLQQEASRKLGYNVKQTMMVAQKLYESGFITYMRTDSLNLSSMAIATAKAQIESAFGEEYSKTRQFHTKTKGAQEAHEAIRPTYLNQPTIEGTNQEKRLYELIWKRTVASQMSDALMEKTTINIGISQCDELFVATGEVIKFDGFLKLYIESTDDDNESGESDTILPKVSVGQQLDYNKIVATERFTQKPYRYNEASLVRKLEELGIGRPSTYAPTISTIQNREYVAATVLAGEERKFIEFTLVPKGITLENKTEIFGAEKGKLIPTDVGMVVNDYLETAFTQIMDFSFTANIEREFDIIAEGELEWTNAIETFYKEFHPNVEQSKTYSDKKIGERSLGFDPASGKEVFVKIGRFGPMVQIGKADDEEKPKFASVLKTQRIDSISLAEALELFNLPRTVGEFEDKEVIAGVGRFGPYVRHNSKFYSLTKEDDALSVTIERAAEIIVAKREQELNSIISTFDEEPLLRVLNGRFGPYISFNKANYKIPKSTDPASLTLEDCRKIIAESPAPKQKPTRGGGRGAKKTDEKPEKTVAKKAPAKKAPAKKSAAKSATAKAKTTTTKKAASAKPTSKKK